MATRRSIVDVGVLVLMSLATSLLIILSLKLQIPEVTEKPQKESEKISLAESEIEIDKPQEINLTIYAPFFFWKKSSEDKLVLTQYTKEGKDIEFPSIIKSNFLITDSSKKRENTTEEVKLSETSKKIALIKNIKVQGKMDDTVQIYDIEDGKFTDFSVSPDIYDYGSHTLNFSEWSPDGRFLYFLYSSEYEKDHNFWVIDTELNTSKIILSGYDINEIGWINNSELAYYVYPKDDRKDADIMSVDVKSGSGKKIGFCPNIWLNQCLFSRHAFPDEDLLFSEVGNNSKIFVYNYKYQTGKELADTLDNSQFARASIIDFSPDRKYMYFSVYQSHTNRQPEEAGTYEFNLEGDYWRHISKDEYQLVMWDKVTSGTEVLLKEESGDNYFLHPVESFEIHPTKLPDKIFRIVN